MAQDKRAMKYTANDAEVRALNGVERGHYEIFLTNFDVEANKETATAADSATSVKDVMFGKKKPEELLKGMTPAKAYTSVYLLLYSLCTLLIIILAIIFVILLIVFLIKKDAITKLYLSIIFMLVVFLLCLLFLVKMVFNLRDDSQNIMEKILFKL